MIRDIIGDGRCFGLDVAHSHDGKAPLRAGGAPRDTSNVEFQGTRMLR